MRLSAVSVTDSEDRGADELSSISPVGCSVTGLVVAPLREQPIGRLREMFGDDGKAHGAVNLISR